MFTTADAARARVSAASLSTLAAAGRITRIRRGVYCLGDPPEAGMALIHVSVAVLGPRAVASHATALFIHGLIDEVSGPVEMAAERSRRGLRPPPWVRLHTTLRPLEGETVVVDGIRATSVVRSILDLAGDRRRAPLAASAARAAVDAGIVGWVDLTRSARRRGERVLRVVASRIGAGRSVAETG